MIRTLIAIICLLVSSLCVAKPLDIVFWHSMSGELEQKLRYIADGFNHSQTAYRIVLVYKGEYIDALTSFGSAFRAKKAPDLLQVFEVGSSVMLHPQGIIKPLNEIISEQAIELPLDNLMPAVTSFYSVDNNIQALPFNLSIPIIYFNADILSQFGVTEVNFPKTWQALELLLQQLKASGIQCGYTSAYPAWIQIESFAALHGLSISNKQDHAKLANHLNRLRRWQTNHFFEYGGRTNDATVLFTSGRCVMFSQSTGSYASLKALMNFKVGIAPLPLDTKASLSRHNNSVGGGALWAISGKSPRVYHGIALFYRYFLQTATQQYWHKNTGYIPLIAEHTTLSDVHSILNLSQRELSRPADKAYYSNIPLNQIRTINEEALESIFSGSASVDHALDEAEKRKHLAIKRFSRNTGQSS